MRIEGNKRHPEVNREIPLMLVPVQAAIKHKG